jgi:hypothetical protein
MFDFQYLLRVSHVSLRGRAIVKSLPAYRNLLEYAPHALAALGRTRLISLHSIATLHATLNLDGASLADIMALSCSFRHASDAAPSA